jgi:hypothetical protein
VGPVVNLLDLQSQACNTSKFYSYFVDLNYVFGTPSLGGRKNGLLVVSENENVIDYNIVVNALRDN